MNYVYLNPMGQEVRFDPVTANDPYPWVDKDGREWPPFLIRCVPA